MSICVNEECGLGVVCVGGPEFSHCPDSVPTVRTPLYFILSDAVAGLAIGSLRPSPPGAVFLPPMVELLLLHGGCVD